MKILLLNLLALLTFNLNAQNKLPAWLIPDGTGRQLYVHGATSFKGDPNMRSASIEVFCLTDKTNHKFQSDENGFFEFFAQENKEYDVIFTKNGCITKNVRVDTKGVPEKSWIKGLSFNLEVALVKIDPMTPPAETSVGWCWFNPNKNKFGFAQHDENANNRTSVIR